MIKATKTQNKTVLSISEFVLSVRFVLIQLVVVTSPRVKQISPEDLNHVDIYAKDFKTWSTEKAFYQALWAQKGQVPAPVIIFVGDSWVVPTFEVDGDRVVVEEHKVGTDTAPRC